MPIACFKFGTVHNNVLYYLRDLKVNINTIGSQYVMVTLPVIDRTKALIDITFLGDRCYKSVD